MNKQQIYDYLKQEKLWHEITEHEAVCDMAALSSVALPYPQYDAKNLFVRDEKIGIIISSPSRAISA